MPRHQPMSHSPGMMILNVLLMVLQIQVAVRLKAKENAQVDLMRPEEDNADNKAELLDFKLFALNIFLHTIMILVNAMMAGLQKIQPVAVLMVLAVMAIFLLMVQYVECLMELQNITLNALQISTAKIIQINALNGEDLTLSAVDSHKMSAVPRDLSLNNQLTKVIFVPHIQIM